MEEEEQNPKNSLFINPLEGYNEERQKRIDQGAQFVDKVVTGGLEKINMPGAEFIGDRARNISGFTADMLIPEDWEIPIMGAAAAIPFDGPLGEAAIYGGGVINRVRRASKGLKRASLANLSNVVDDAFSKANSLFNRGQPGWRLATANGADLGQQAAKPLQITTGSGGGGGISRGFGQNFVPPNPSEVSKITQKLLNEHVLIGKDRVFDYNAFRALFTGNKRGRLLEGWMQTTPHFKIPNWEKHRQELVDVFESIYGDVMQLKDIPRKQIQVDHLVTLRSTMPIYDGVAFGSPLWNNIQETLLRSKNKYNPGNTLANLDALDPGSHIVKTNFFNKRLGKDGEVFFTTERLKYMKESDANRMEVLKDWLKIQDEGTAILREAQNVWKTLYKIDNVELPEEILNKLSKIRIGEFSHPELRNLGKLRGIIKDIIKDEVKRSSLGLKDLTKAVDDRTELDAYKSVRQLQQDVDPADLPKTTKVKSKKKQLEKELTKEPKPKVEKKSKKKNPDQGELDI